MKQIYKVFINNRVILIANLLENTKDNDQWTQYNYEHIKNDDQLINQLFTSTSPEYVFIASEYPENAFNELFSEFKPIDAAGGLVVSENEEYLFIFRKGKWDLPKGKLEKNEEIEKGAMREVEEECGITGLSIETPLPTTYHIYQQNNVWYLKTTYWFVMKCDENQHLVPQTEEGITEVEWIDKTNLSKVFANTYALIKDTVSAMEKDSKKV